MCSVVILAAMSPLTLGLTYVCLGPECLPARSRSDCLFLHLCKDVFVMLLCLCEGKSVSWCEKLGRLLEDT